MNRFDIARYPELFNEDCVLCSGDDDGDYLHYAQAMAHNAAITKRVDDQPVSEEDSVYRYMVVDADNDCPGVVVSPDLTLVAELSDPMDFFREQMALQE